MLQLVHYAGLASKCRNSKNGCLPCNPPLPRRVRFHPSPPPPTILVPQCSPHVAAGESFSLTPGPSLGLTDFWDGHLRLPILDIRVPPPLKFVSKVMQFAFALSVFSSFWIGFLGVEGKLCTHSPSFSLPVFLCEGVAKVRMAVQGGSSSSFGSAHFSMLATRGTY